jgi:hypothetical protein
MTADGFGGWGVAEERKVAMEVIRTKSDDAIKRWEGLLAVAKLNKASVEAHDEKKTFEQLIGGLMNQVHSKKQDGVIIDQHAEDALKQLSKAGEPLPNPHARLRS